MTCPPACSCLLCQIAAPREIGISSRAADEGPIDDGHKRRGMGNSDERQAGRERREANPVESILRRVNLKPARRVVQTGRRK